MTQRTTFEADLLIALRALSNERRFAILDWLKSPRSHFREQVDGDLVSDGVCGASIAEKLGVPQLTASEHMRVLVRARLVETKRIKRWTFYSRDEKRICELKRLFSREVQKEAALGRRAMTARANEGASLDRLRLSPDELAAFLDEVFPAATRPNLGQLVSVAPERVRTTLQPLPSMTRPGGTVSGPILMGVIDFAAYAVVLAHIGRAAMAVTNTLSVSFLKPCRVEPVFVDAHLLKLGRRFASIDARVWQSDEDRLVAHAIVGYALP